MSAPLLYYSDDFLEHRTNGHPESPERLTTIIQHLQTQNLWSKLKLIEPQALDKEYILKCHSLDHYREVKGFCAFSTYEGKRIDEDTVASRGSFKAALRSAGAAVELVDALLNQKAKSGFSLGRPPGHHAMPEKTMGFCFFNNIAIAARYAMEQYSLKRILILDWDAHHGNATEHMFYDDPRVMFVSWHQDPNWPGTGAIQDTGHALGKGYNINIPLPVESGGQALIQTFDQIVYPLALNFAPELILVSAGYDPHPLDPLTDMNVTASDFSLLTEKVMQLADHTSKGQAGFLLEGGYSLEGLAYSVEGTIRTLLQEESQTIKEPQSYSFQAPEIDGLIQEIQTTQPLFKEVTP